MIFAFALPLGRSPACPAVHTPPDIAETKPHSCIISPTLGKHHGAFFKSRLEELQRTEDFGEKSLEGITACVGIAYVTHADEGYKALCQSQRPGVSLAGFQVTFIGRFWVTADEESGFVDEKTKTPFKCPSTPFVERWDVDIARGTSVMDTFVSLANIQAQHRDTERRRMPQLRWLADEKALERPSTDRNSYRMKETPEQ